MKNNYFFIGTKNFFVLNENLEAVFIKENEGLIDLENIKNPVSSYEDLFNVVSDIYRKFNFKTMVLSDICFNCQVIDIENFPLSHAKREEVLTWKLGNLLPYKVDSYNVRYRLVDKDKVLFYALPVTIYGIVNKLMEELGLKCWDIMPESSFITGFLPDLSKNTLFLINRRDYYIGMFFQKGIVTYLKVRKKVAGISFEEEIELIKKVIYEKFSLDIEEYILCGKENMPGFKQIFKGFGFED